MWTRDEGPSPGDPTKNLYGVHPFYLCLEGDGNAHGVLFYNSHAQEVTNFEEFSHCKVTFGTAPSVTYRAIGPPLEILFFPGPKPTDVIEQYHAYIGRPAMPSYWSLGFQLSRWGYHNVSEVERVVNRTRAAGIPQDVQFVDIDYMDGRRDFTYDKTAFAQLPLFIDKLHSMKMRNILILDPAIAIDYDVFKRGLDVSEYSQTADLS